MLVQGKVFAEWRAHKCKAVGEVGAFSLLGHLGLSQSELLVSSQQCWTQEAAWELSLLEQADHYPSHVHPGGPKDWCSLPL